MPLEPLAEVRRRVVGSVGRLAATKVGLAAAAGCVLAESVVAPEAVPPFANTAMDGFAVKAGDTARARADDPVMLRVIGEVRAGAVFDGTVGDDEAVRIMTGAPMPAGADAIVPVEATFEKGPEVGILSGAAVGDHVRPAGGDLRPGDEAFAAGTSIGPAHVGMLASIGAEAVEVYRRPRVAVLSTGDELVEGGGLRPGQIRDSNRPQLLALVAEAGAEPVDLGIARDDEAEVRTRITEGIETCDALVTSGGVSVGDYDFVKLVLEQLAAERGGEYRWTQVAIKPAKPFAFGVVGSTPVFGLPGNPVSSHVSFELFARPAIRRMAGHAVLDRPRVSARAGATFGRHRDGKLHLDRVRLSSGPDGFVAVRSGVQASNVLSGLANANGLAMIPDGEGVAEGETVAVMVLADPEALDVDALGLLPDNT